jgi:hypothetical protein
MCRRLGGCWTSNATPRIRIDCGNDSVRETQGIWSQGAACRLQPWADVSFWGEAGLNNGVGSIPDMDDRRFDAWTKTLTDAMSRRGALRRLGLAGAVAALAGVFGRQGPTAANHCSYEGCGCSSGTQHACGHGLVCCSSSPGTPGGAGVCTPRGRCGGCISRGNACAGHCNWGDGCVECCTGYCGNRGACDTPPNLNATCTSGTQSPCLYGLTCCSYVPGLAGGAGSCEYSC